MVDEPTRNCHLADLKRLFLLVCQLSAVVSLAGCTRPYDAWDRVLETGVLRVGMDASFPPFEYVDGGGNLVGFDVDLAREVAERLGVEAQFVANLSYDGLYDALTADQVDVVISALYADAARTADFAYSASYFNAGQVLVMARTGPAVEGMDDLGGRTLAVEFGSEGDVVARAWARRLAELWVLPCQSADEALAKVASGEADAALVDHLTALAGAAEGSSLQIAGHTVTDEPYAAAVRRDSQGLLRAVNRVLADLEADGTLRRLRRHWFVPAP